MAIPPGGIADPTDRDALLDAFVQTYEGYDRDPAFIFDTFQRYQEYAINNPDAGSSKVANALEVPRSMVRKWVDDNAIPYVAQGVQTVERRGWDDLDWDGAEMHALAHLVAWTFSSGTIHHRKFDPVFVVDDDHDLTRLADSLRCLGLRPQAIDADGERDRAVRGETMSVSADGVVLGRLLAALGAPVGRKAGVDDLQLPQWLTRAPERIRRAFAQTYVANRARGERVATVTFSEDRPDSYTEALVALLRDVTGEHVTTTGDHDVNVSKAAAEALGLDPYTAEVVDAE